MELIFHFLSITLDWVDFDVNVRRILLLLHINLLAFAFA
jgi:hypothetical protein